MKKETGLMFKAPLVRAILSGQKTQTRRLWKMPSGCVWYEELGGEKEGWVTAPNQPWWTHVEEFRCPMGKPGDRIYVREAHAHHPQFPQMAFRADGEEFEDADGWRWEPKWTPAIHMKKEEARIWLEITGVRVERLQQITEADAKAEGVQPWPCDHPRRSCADIDCDGPDYLAGFRDIWQSTGGDWAANPWVWVIDFKTISTTGRPA